MTVDNPNQEGANQSPDPQGNGFGDLLGNEPQGTDQQTGTGGGQLSEADMRRIAQEEAKRLARSEAYKAENRISENVNGQISDIKNVLQALARQNPNLNLKNLSEEQIRAAQREMVMNNIADQMLEGKLPNSPGGSRQGTSQMPGDNQQDGSSSSNQAYLKLRIEEVFAEEGEQLSVNDPEAQSLPDPKTISQGQLVVEIRKAVQAKKVRMATNPNARVASHASGVQTGGLGQQYQQEKAKLPRGQARAKMHQELRMKYQRMGLDTSQLD